MHSTTILAVSGLAALAAATAIPQQHAHHHHHKRAVDYVWVTETAEEVVTVPVTQTVWVEPGETVPAQSHWAPQAQHTDAAPSPSPESTHVAPAPPASTSTSTSSSSSEYVPPPPAPTTSSTSEYVPPPPAPTTTSTSEYVPPPAPTTSTTSEYVPPPAPTTTETPTSTWVAPTSAWSSPAAAASPSGGSSSGGGSGITSGVAAAGTSNTGDLTWYAVGLGACGITNVASDHIVAIAESTFDAYSTGNPNTNPLCGQKVTITGKDGSAYTATIVDRCTGCKAADLDLSEDFFNLVTSNGDGRVSGMKWTYD